MEFVTTTHSFTFTENTISQSFIVVKNLKTNSQPNDHHSKLTTGVGRGVRGEGGWCVDGTRAMIIWLTLTTWAVGEG